MGLYHKSGMVLFYVSGNYLVKVGCALLAKMVENIPDLCVSLVSFLIFTIIWRVFSQIILNAFTFVRKVF